MRVAEAASVVPLSPEDETRDLLLGDQVQRLDGTPEISGVAVWQGGHKRIGANRMLVYQYLITLTGVNSGIVFFDESLGTSKLSRAPRITPV